MVVDLAFDGITGLDLATTNHYDILVVDLMLPKLDGITLISELRKQNTTTPILILSAKDQPEDKIGGLNSGADDYLSKPFSFGELIARIHALTRRQGTLQNNTLQVGDLSINRTTFEIKRGDRILHLSNKEFALLEYLMGNPNQTLEKQGIIDHVWDYDANILNNTLEVFIKKLRDKVDKPFPDSKPMIITVRGFGYRIEG